jgi:hypothetical protein
MIFEPKIFDYINKKTDCVLERDVFKNGEVYIIVDIVKQYIDHDKIFKSSFENKLSDFYEAMHWGRVPENNNLSKFFTF